MHWQKFDSTFEILLKKRKKDSKLRLDSFVSGP